MEILNIPIQAGETKSFAMAGQYIEVLDCDGTLDVILYGQTGAVESARGAEAGSWMKESFTHFTLASSIAQTVKMLITGREGGSRRTAGAVAVTNVNGDFLQASVNVTNVAGGVQLLDVNPARRYLLLQNRDAVNSVYVTLNGSPASTGLGILIEPGGALEFSNYAPTGKVRAIASGATASVVLVEG